MTEQRFEEIVEETLEQLRNTLITKGREYRRNGNPFHNFDSGANITGLLREEVLDGFKLKHEVSVNDIVNDLNKGILPSKETVNEKLGDILVYTIIKKISLIDRIEEFK